MSKQLLFSLLFLASLTFSRAQAAEPTNENNNSQISQDELTLLKELFVKNVTNSNRSPQEYSVSIPGIKNLLAYHFPNYTMLTNPNPSSIDKPRPDEVYLTNSITNEQEDVWVQNYGTNKVIIGSDSYNKQEALYSLYSSQSSEIDHLDLRTPSQPGVDFIALSFKKSDDSFDNYLKKNTQARIILRNLHTLNAQSTEIEIVRNPYAKK